MKIKTALLIGLPLALAVFVNSQTSVYPPSGGGAPSGAAGGDLGGTYPDPAVTKINGTTLSGLGTGLLKNTTGTGVPFISKVTLTEPATAGTLTIIDGTVITGPAATDTLVGRTSTDTMTNKTLTTPTVVATGWTNANHAHVAANSGGILTYAAVNQDRTVMTFAEEWISGSTTNGFLGTLNWRKGETTVACTVSSPASEDNHPGIQRLATSTVNPDSCTLFMQSGYVYGLAQKAPWKAQAILRIGSITTGKYYFGLYAGTASNRIWIYFDPAESATWRFETDAAGTNTVGNSTITAAANTWYRMTVEMTTAGTVLFSVDSETPVARSTNVPGSTILLTPYHTIQNTTAASNTMDIDWTAFHYTSVAR